MTSKTTLSLIEQIIMVLVFSIATAICLKIFVYSNNLSTENETRDHAVSMTRNAAEILKATHGDIDKAASSCGSYDGLSINIDKVETGSEYLGKARVYVTDNNGEIYALEVCWQEDVA